MARSRPVCLALLLWLGACQSPAETPPLPPARPPAPPPDALEATVERTDRTVLEVLWKMEKTLREKERRIAALERELDAARREIDRLRRWAARGEGAACGLSSALPSSHHGALSSCRAGGRERHPHGTRFRSALLGHHSEESPTSRRSGMAEALPRRDAGRPGWPAGPDRSLILDPVLELPDRAAEHHDIQKLPASTLALLVNSIGHRGNDPDGPIAAFTEALRMSPRHERACGGLARALTRHREYRRARRADSRALELARAAGDTIGNPAGAVRTGVFFDPAHAGSVYGMAVVSLNGAEKLIAVGPDSSTGTGYVMRLDAAGDVDASFGNQGKVSVPLETAYDVAVDSSRRIVVVGQQDSPARFTIVRLLADGSLDAQVGTNGVVQISIGRLSSGARAVAIQADGKIVVGGDSGGRWSSAFALARLNDDGSLDTLGFGDPAGGGKKKKPGGGDPYKGYTMDDIDPRANDRVRQGLIALEQDGKETKIILGGYQGLFKGHLLVRYHADGSVDRGFADGGRLFVTFPGRNLDFEQLWGLAVSASGEIYAGGRIGPSDQPPWGPFDAFVARYAPDGTLDTSFGQGGLAQTNLPGEDNGSEIAVQADGKILIAGNVATGNPQDTADFMSFRWKSDGTPDTTYGPSGTGQSVLASTGAMYGDGDWCIALDPGGVFVGGNSNFENVGSVCSVAKYHR